MFNATQLDEFVSFPFLLKATPAEEAGERFIYIEASNEGVDQQGEIVLSSALAASAQFYKNYGNVDLDHYTILGPKSGIQNPMQYEIGKPVEVRIEKKHTFVKAQLYTGQSDLARNANMVWESMTAISPPARWYPSVGGAVIEKSQEFDPETNNRVIAIKAVRWTNIGLSKTPVNQHVPTASAAPMGVFAKSMNCFVMKALEAGTSTKSAGMTGGGALTRQSLDRGMQSYFDFRERISAAIRGGKVGRDITTYAINQWGLSHDTASAWAERYLRGIKQSTAARRLH
jgi:hypothetical protein